MKINNFSSILCFGILIDWSLVFLFALLVSLTDIDFRPAVWLILLIITLILYWMREIGKIEDKDVLRRIEHALLIINLVAVVFALFIFGMTFSTFWLAKDVRYFSFALGLPSTIVLVYWILVKHK